MNTGESRTDPDAAVSAAFRREMQGPPVCPICRASLAPSGACLRCHGSRTPQDRYTWSFPGDRYETHDEQGRAVGNGDEWIWRGAGPRSACTPEQNAEQAGMLARVLGTFAERAKVL